MSSADWAKEFAKMTTEQRLLIKTATPYLSLADTECFTKATFEELYEVRKRLAVSFIREKNARMAEHSDKSDEEWSEISLAVTQELLKKFGYEPPATRVTSLTPDEKNC